MKEIPIRKWGNFMDRDHLEKVIKEIDTLSKFKDNKNIIRFYGFVIENATIYLFMELVEGPTLERLISTIRNMEVVDQKHFSRLFNVVAYASLQALNFCYRKNIRHGDIKPANMLFTKRGQLKLIDFGDSSKMDEYVSGGTLMYYSPQRFLSENPPSIDLWSLGITLLEIIYEKHPLFHYKKFPTYESYTNETYSIVKEVLSDLSISTLLEPIKYLKFGEKEFFKDFIQLCLSNEQDDKIFNELFNLIDWQILRENSTLNFRQLLMDKIFWILKDYVIDLNWVS